MDNNILYMFNKKKITGLYIGDNTVEFALLKRTVKGPELIKCGQTYIYPEGASEKDMEEETKDDHIIEAIKRLFKENNLRPLNVVFGLPDKEALVRYFQIPKIPKKEWKAAINFEAARYIPFHMEEVISDYRVFQTPSSNNMDVVFVAVRQDVISRFVSLLEKAEVRPIIIEPASFSLMRVFNLSGQVTSNINCSVVDIDTKTATINIIRKGKPYMVRDVDLSEDASEGESPDALFETIVSEIKLSFDFYKKQFPSEKLDKIIINTSTPIKDKRELIARELELPVELGDPFSAIRTLEGASTPSLAISFGLAIRCLSKSLLDITLPVAELPAYKQKEMFLKIMYLEASVAVIVLIILKVVCVKALGPIREELDLTMSERPKLGLGIKNDSVNELKKLISEMEAKRDVLENMIDKRTYVTARLNELPDLLPNNIWLKELEFREGLDEKDTSKVARHLSIDGYCTIGKSNNERDIVKNFLIELERSAAIKNGMSSANIVSVKRDEIEGEEVASFKILFEGP